MDFAACATQEFAVSSGFSQDTKELVKQAIDIVDLVGAAIQLRRQGRNYVGLCPWHDDSRPSLQVNPTRQSFKCWVCDIGGDIFDFVMKMEGVSFPEALAMLADRAGVEVKQTRSPAPGMSGVPGAPPGHDKRTLFQAMGWAVQQYHECLLNMPEAEPARRYLQERGITPESIEKFQLGFSPLERDWLLRKVSGSPSRTRILEQVGILTRSSEGGNFYDRFKGRLLFSIRDAQARPVGIGGRVLPELGSTSPAKYVNSPETPLFSKSHLLYGLDLAKDAMRKSRTAMVMEGYTDVIVAHQYGFGDAVAVLGTALGEGHIRILKRFCDRVLLVLDGDEAGQKRSNEVLELFVAQQVDLRILTLPEGLDPCDFLHQHGAEAFAEQIATRAVDALEHAFLSVTRGVDVDRDIHGASQALERLVSIVAKAPRLTEATRNDRFREEKILQRLSAWFRVDEREVRQRMTALRRSAARPRPTLARPAEEGEALEATAVEEPSGKLDAWQRELMELLVGQPECWPEIRAGVNPQWLATAACRRIYETCCRLSDSGTAPSFDRLMLAIDEPPIKSLLVEFDVEAQAKRAGGGWMGDPVTRVNQLILTYQQKEAQKQQPAQNVALREGSWISDKTGELLESILQQQRNRHGISEPTDG